MVCQRHFVCFHQGRNRMTDSSAVLDHERPCCPSWQHPLQTRWRLSIWRLFSSNLRGVCKLHIHIGADCQKHLGYVYTGIKDLGHSHRWHMSADSGLQGLGCRAKNYCVDVQAQTGARALEPFLWMSTQQFYSPLARALQAQVSWPGPASGV